MTLVVLELKPAEVEFLSEWRRCGRCDHLGALHVDRLVFPDCEDEWCDCGIPKQGQGACMIDECGCEDFR